MMDFDQSELDYAGGIESMDYLYDFFDADLARVVQEDRTYIPEGMEDLLAEDSLEDFIWLWIKDKGPNSYWQYLVDGEFGEETTRALYASFRKEWAIDSPPHVAWFHADGSEVPTV